ncbi:MAG: ATP-binding cassette domain-containing protein [Bacilli bacterium]|nr:ATP-binding cassette domain-containing protein [Bacilli bacterium]
MKDIIKVEHLIKKYDKLTAVDDITFNVKEGDLFAFLGPNGAGKSTTINILCTILDKTSGNIEINGLKLGINDEEIRNNIGVVFQSSNLDDLLTVLENIKTRATFYNIETDLFDKRLEYISNMIGIKDILNRPYGKLSGGQKRRVDIARALINEPKILFLDEPTTGLDPQTREKVWEVLAEIQKKNKTTIFLTTHYMEEASNADKIAIIDNGKLIIHDTPMKMKEKYTSNMLRIMPKDNNKLIKYLDKFKYAYKIKVDNTEVFVKNSLEALKILKEIENNLFNFEVIEGNMDSVFINLTGKDIRED